MVENMTTKDPVANATTKKWKAATIVMWVLVGIYVVFTIYVNGGPNFPTFGG